MANQDAEGLPVKKFERKNLVMVIILQLQNGVPYSCWRYIENSHAKIEKNKLKDTSLVLISIDPTNDTPEVLKNSQQKEIWIPNRGFFLRSDEESTRVCECTCGEIQENFSDRVFHTPISSVFSTETANW